MYFNNIIGFLKGLLDVLSPFLWSIAITFLLCPLVKKFNLLLDKIHKFKFNRGASILLAYIVFIAFITFIFVCVLPDVFNSIVEIIAKIPEYFDQLQTFLKKYNIDIGLIDLNIMESFILEKAQEFLNFITNSIPHILNVSMNVIGLLFSILISFAFSVYLTIDLERIKKFANYAGNIIFGKEKNSKIRDVVIECSTSINNFLVGKIIDSLIIGILLFIILNIFGFKYSLLISFIVGITNIIPDIGPVIGAIPGLLIYLAISPGDALTFGIIILCLQQFDGMILGPKILGDKLGIRPILILPSVIIGGYYFGVIGMILGVPLVAVLLIYLDRFLKRKEGGEKNE